MVKLCFIWLLIQPQTIECQYSWCNKKWSQWSPISLLLDPVYFGTLGGFCVSLLPEDRWPLNLSDLGWEWYWVRIQLKGLNWIHWAYDKESETLRRLIINNPRLRRDPQSDGEEKRQQMEKWWRKDEMTSVTFHLGLTFRLGSITLWAHRPSSSTLWWKSEGQTNVNTVPSALIGSRCPLDLQPQLHHSFIFFLRTAAEGSYYGGGGGQLMLAALHGTFLPHICSQRAVAEIYQSNQAAAPPAGRTHTSAAEPHSCSLNSSHWETLQKDKSAKYNTANLLLFPL